MPDYQSMYLKLFDTVTEAMEKLCKVQKETVEMYLNALEDESLTKNEINENPHKDKKAP